MKREIKFRGLHKGVFVYGNLIQAYWGDVSFTEIEQSDSFDFEKWGIEDDDTIGQYTGLKDINGVEIYEGDIVRGLIKSVHNIFDEKNWTLVDEVGIVKMEDSSWMLWNEDEYAKGIITRYDTIEVIGNIHENPELL